MVLRVMLHPNLPGLHSHNPDQDTLEKEEEQVCLTREITVPEDMNMTSQVNIQGTHLYLEIHMVLDNHHQMLFMAAVVRIFTGQLLFFYFLNERALTI